MIKKYNLNDIDVKTILAHTEAKEDNVDDTVIGIIKDVRSNGDHALLYYAKKFDHAELSTLEVTEEEIETAFAEMDDYFIETLEIAKENITLFHQEQRHKNFHVTTKTGAMMGQRYTPIAKVGLYVPGGTASYPSTVLMDAIPAKIAGVKDIVMVTPPNRDGNIPKEILVAAKIAGVTKIFKTGGAQAIAALAYGTETIPKVDKVVGPGNIFVATAKRMVYGVIDIDMIAGPSDVLVIADASANPRYIAADMLAQAEHDKLATAILITTSDAIADAVIRELELQIPQLERAEIAGHSINATGKIIVAESIAQAIAVSNELAPEHLELCVEEPFAILDSIQNAGSIFLGQNTPEALGDYLAGTNHTLPTGGRAKFSSPLSVDDFVKKSSFLYYPQSALFGIKDRVIDFAMREGLQAHANSIKVRFETET